MPGMMHAFRSKSSAAGFSLIELMITLVVLAIVISLAAPAFQEFVSNQRVKTDTQDLFSALLYARSEAIKRNASVAVVPGPADSWTAGWAVTLGTAGGTAKTYAQCVADSSNCFRIQQALSGSVVASALTGVTFDRTGRMVDPGVARTFTLCDSKSSAAVRKRVITLDLSGRPTISQEGKCNA